jgi:DNA-binding transcriptional LysR family regulator
MDAYSEKDMNPNLDIQNILVLKKMYELRNVGLVADALGKTPGAISKNLSKLKTQLDDPLFIQTKHGFEPTSFVEANIKHFDSILDSVASIKPEGFSPETYQGPIKIYANNHFWQQLGDKLYLALLKRAPRATVSFLHWDNNARNRLIDGENAIAAHYFDVGLPQSIAQAEFGRGTVVFFVRNDHPATVIEDLAQYPVVIYKSAGWNDNKYPLIERLSNIGFKFTPKAEVAHPQTLHEIVMQTDHFGVTTDGSVPNGCRSIHLPQDLKLEISFVMSCRRSQQHDPINQWLLRILKQTIIANRSQR